MMKNRYIIKLLILLISSIFTSASIAEATISMKVDRAWGLLLGDEIYVRADLSSLEDGLDKSSLPKQGQRYGTWLYLKAITVDTEKLVFQYQIVNVPDKNTSIDTPQFDVKQQNGKWSVIPPISVTIGPSLAIGAGNIVAKGDIVPTLISTMQGKQQLKRFSILAVLSGIVLVFWHFGWRTKNRQPFAQAVHDLSRLKWRRSATPDQASRILHTAFNRTSDTIVVYGEIDNLVQQYPWLKGLQDEIQLFYQQSEQHFFARQAGQEPDIEMIRKLAKACRAKEMLA